MFLSIRFISRVLSGLLSLVSCCPGFVLTIFDLAWNTANPSSFPAFFLLSCLSDLFSSNTQVHRGRDVFFHHPLPRCCNCPLAERNAAVNRQFHRDHPLPTVQKARDLHAGKWWWRSGATGITKCREADVPNNLGYLQSGTKSRACCCGII